MWLIGVVCAREEGRRLECGNVMTLSTSTAKRAKKIGGDTSADILGLWNSIATIFGIPRAELGLKEVKDAILLLVDST